MGATLSAPQAASRLRALTRMAGPILQRTPKPDEGEAIGPSSPRKLRDATERTRKTLSPLAMANILADTRGLTPLASDPHQVSFMVATPVGSFFEVIWDDTTKRIYAGFDAKRSSTGPFEYSRYSSAKPQGPSPHDDNPTTFRKIMMR